VLNRELPIVPTLAPRSASGDCDLIRRARVVRDPDPRSKAAYIRLIGYAQAAGFVLTVIIDPRASPA
jgi:hypothetical protein